MWYVLHLFVDLDKFLTRYQSLPKTVRAQVRELVTLRQPSKALYQRDLSLFVGYVFVRVDSRHIKRVHEALRTEGIAEVLTPPGTPYLMPMRADEVDWIYSLLQSRGHHPVSPGSRVRITRGPFEGMEGEVDTVAGTTVSVRVVLRRTVSVAQCTPDSLEVL